MDASQTGYYRAQCVRSAGKAEPRLGRPGATDNVCEYRRPFGRCDPGRHLRLLVDQEHAERRRASPGP